MAFAGSGRRSSRTERHQKLVPLWYKVAPPAEPSHVHQSSGIHVCDAGLPRREILVRQKPKESQKAGGAFHSTSLSAEFWEPTERQSEPHDVG